MDKDLIDQFQDSEVEWADIQRLRYELEEKERKRTLKDQNIISRYCGKNDYADITTTLELLLKYPGLAKHDQETVEKFKECYPKKLTVGMIHEYEDVVDIYSEYLESGGEYND